MRLTPTPRLVLAMVLLAAAGALVHVLAPAHGELWWLLTGMVLAGTLLDLLGLWRTPSPRVERTVARNLPVAAWSPVTLILRNPLRRHLTLTVHDLHPSGFEVRGQPAPLTLGPGQYAELRYHLRPRRRGAEAFAGTDVELASPFGLWRLRRRLPLEQPLRVYPNFAEIAHYTLLATDNRLSQLGVRRRQRRGEGSDFHQLREYRQGDSLRQIDWKATSRYIKLISREYQDERDQQILFLLDCGHNMRHEDGDRIHIDDALNAVLLLSYVALHQGDAVGLMTFGGERRWFAPRKGVHVVNALLNTTYDIQASAEAADYLAAATQLVTLQRRRALVVLITNARDEERSDLEAAVRILRRHHLVVVADLREAVLDELMERPVADLDQALTFQAAQSYRDIRRQAHELLHHRGAHVLDLRPQQLPAALVKPRHQAGGSVVATGGQSAVNDSGSGSGTAGSARCAGY